MKKVILLMLMSVIFIVGCDNNSGPFVARKEQGRIYLYSNEKLAKGWVATHSINPYSGLETLTKEVEYNKGLPTGKFKLYDLSGDVFLEGNSKNKGDIFKGKFLAPDTEIIGELDAKLLEKFIYNFEGNGNYNTILNYNAIINIIINATLKVNYENGQLQRKVTIKNRKKEGPYEEYYENGKLQAKGAFKAGNYDGPYEEYYENGKLQTKGAFKAGNYDGPFEFYYENGKLQKKMSFRIGNSAGDYGTKIEGPYEFYYPNGQLQEKGTYKSDEKDGPFEAYYENGQLSIKGAFKFGYFSGPFEYYYENGKLKEKFIYTTSGRKEGPYESYYENGQLKEKCTYNLYGKKEGLYEFYDETGELIEKKVYENGREISYYYTNTLNLN